ncbi:hypothetical protein BC938DRAFT_484083 [Jimgerdemannia flammicorona]|uniref:Uncharacterized protein n=1 Tax=Jimgerdemannia flammicorona TaxID=994334 RepID=A0A433QAL6_9FUNG|nr:hypothetical protein BC938DRAFT_484083 [Jimgerdemannia flammicorona]
MPFRPNIFDAVIIVTLAADDEYWLIWIAESLWVNLDELLETNALETPDKGIDSNPAAVPHTSVLDFHTLEPIRLVDQAPIQGDITTSIPHTDAASLTEALNTLQGYLDSPDLARLECELGGLGMAHFDLYARGLEPFSPVIQDPKPTRADECWIDR